MNRRKDITKRLSKAKYRELFYFCIQYEEKKHTGKEKDKKDCELIETTANTVSEEIAEYLIKNVTKGICYEYMQVPCGRRQFYNLREEFYYQLSLRR